MNSTLTLFGLGTAAVAIFAEYHYKTHPGQWFEQLPFYLCLQAAISYGVYRMVTTPATSLIGAFVVWTFSTITLRCLVSQFVLHETVPPGTWAAVGLIVLARITQQLWR